MSLKNRKLIKKMQERGWSASLTRKGHIRFEHDETGEVLIHSGSPSDHRAQKNHMARVRRIEGKVAA